MQTLGISHITLTVKDIQKECQFYSVLFSARFEITEDTFLKGVFKFHLRSISIPVSFREPRTTGLHPWLPVVRGEYTETDRDAVFDYKQIGLDHFAIQIPDEKELEMIHGKIVKAWKAVDQNVLNGKTKGIEVCQYTGRKYICFYDPSGIPVEFYIPRSEFST